MCACERLHAPPPQGCSQGGFQVARNPPPPHTHTHTHKKIIHRPNWVKPRGDALGGSRQWLETPLDNSVLPTPLPPPQSCRPIHACNMPSRSVEIKQPPQRRPKLAIHCRVPLSLYCRVSPPPQPGLAVSTSRSCRIHCRVPLPLLPGPAVSTAGSRRLSAVICVSALCMTSIKKSEGGGG